LGKGHIKHNKATTNNELRTFRYGRAISFPDQLTRVSVKLERLAGTLVTYTKTLLHIWLSDHGLWFLAEDKRAVAFFPLGVYLLLPLSHSS